MWQQTQGKYLVRPHFLSGGLSLSSKEKLFFLSCPRPHPHNPSPLSHSTEALQPFPLLYLVRHPDGWGGGGRRVGP